MEQHGTFGVFKDDVAKRVAFGFLLCDLRIKIVVGVLGFPIAPAQVVAILQGAIGVDELAADFEFLLGDERPVMLLCGHGQQTRKGRFGGPFMRDAVRDEGAECREVFRDVLVGGLDGGWFTHAGEGSNVDGLRRVDSSENVMLRSLSLRFVRGS